MKHLGNNQSREKYIVNWVKGPSVLDVGCTDQSVRYESEYWLHRHLYESFPYVVGIDISEENINLMKKLGYKNLSVQNAETFRFDEQFDTIVAGEIIEHLANPGLFLEQVRIHLQKEGRLIITTQNPFSLLHFFYAVVKYPKTCQNVEHTCWYCIETLSNLVKRYDYKILHIEEMMEFEFDDPSWKYRWFARFMSLFKFIFPKLWRANTLIFVLTPE